MTLFLSQRRFPKKERVSGRRPPPRGVNGRAGVRACLQDRLGPAQHYDRGKGVFKPMKERGEVRRSVPPTQLFQRGKKRTGSRRGERKKSCQGWSGRATGERKYTLPSSPPVLRLGPSSGKRKKPGKRNRTRFGGGKKPSSTLAEGERIEERALALLSIGATSRSKGKKNPWPLGETKFALGHPR